MAQLGNTGINGNLMVVGKLVASGITASESSTFAGIACSSLTVNGGDITCGNLKCTTINSKTPITASYDSSTNTLTISSI